MNDVANNTKSPAARIFGTEEEAANFIRQLAPEDVVGVVILPDVMKPTIWLVRYTEYR
jgi:hypothetical protein